MARSAASTAPAGSDLGAIEHVVFLMQENRSFDHYYGTYRGVRGFDDHPAHSLGAFAQAWPGGPDPTLLPFHLDSASGIGECTHDLDHTWPAQHLCRGVGDNAHFVSTHTSSAYEGPEQGVMTMGYYRPQRPALLLRAGRRLHHLRQLPLLGARADGPQPPHGDVGHDRPHGRTPAARCSSPTRTPTPSTASAGTPCPRCSRTPASAGRSTTRRARSTRPRSSSSTAS